MVTWALDLVLAGQVVWMIVLIRRTRKQGRTLDAKLDQAEALLNLAQRGLREVQVHRAQTEAMDRVASRRWLGLN